MAAKLFLGGIAPTTQKEDIERHFSVYGTVIDSVVMYKDGRHRGFGFVTFAEPEAMDAVLSEAQVIHDRTIDVKPAVPSDEAPPPRSATAGFGGGGGSFSVFAGGAPPVQRHFGGGSHYGGSAPPAYGGGGGGCGGGGIYKGGPFSPPGVVGGVGGGCRAMPSSTASYGGGYGAAPRVGKGRPSPAGLPPWSGGGGGGGHVGLTDKVFIGGLAPTTTDDTLNMYFGQYGTLVDVVVMKDKVTQKSRGFGFVRYDTPEPVEQVIADYDHHEIDGKWIEVKKAVPQEQMGASSPYGGGGGGFAGRGGFCQPARPTAYGAPSAYGGGAMGYPGPADMGYPGAAGGGAYNAFARQGGGAYVGAGRGGMRARPY